jgi:hypothetical protein
MRSRNWEKVRLSWYSLVLKKEISRASEKEAKLDGVDSSDERWGARDALLKHSGLETWLSRLDESFYNLTSWSVNEKPAVLPSPFGSASEVN